MANKKDKNQRGQIHISLGMIFSIILIIIFIGFAFFVIQKFLGLQGNIQLNQFYDNLQNDVNSVWNSAQSTQEKSYDMPSSVGKICFLNAEGENMIIYGTDNRPTGSTNIENINISAMTPQGSLCFNAVNSKINLILQKNFSDTLVTITK